MATLFALSAVLGLVVGSFLNVVIYRVPRGFSVVRPGSSCPACATPLRRRHNIPALSWIALRGKCGFCRAPISPRYPVVELGTAALFVALVARFGITANLPAYLYLAAIAVALTAIDLDRSRLPEAIVLPSLIVAPCLLVPAAASVGTGLSLVARAGLGGLAYAGIVFALRLARPRAVRPEDVQVAGLAGCYLGFLSWTAVVVGAAIAVLLGAATASITALARNRSPQSALRIGSALLGGAVIAVVATGHLAWWHGSLSTSTT